MAGAGGVELAVAAMAGGAVGALPCAMLTPEAVREQVAEVRTRAEGRSTSISSATPCPRAPTTRPGARCCSATTRPMASPRPPARARSGCRSTPTCARSSKRRVPELVSFLFGLPEDALLDRVRHAGCRVLATATTVDEARWLAERGVDAIVAQGFEAGGHAGRFLPESRPEEQMGLFALLPQIVDATGLPVIAAGGIADGRGIAAAFVLGAAAVQVGTAYLLSPESLIGGIHRTALHEAEAEHSAFTNLFSGGLARACRRG